MMKHVLFIILLSISLTSFSQDTLPSGFPITTSTGWIRYGYLQNDSGRIDANRDTNFTPRFIPTTVYWAHAGVDSCFWTYTKTTGQRWVKSIFSSSSGSSGWNLTGNSGTTVGTNFIG